MILPDLSAFSKVKALTTEYIEKSGLLCTVLSENMPFSVRH